MSDQDSFKIIDLLDPLRRYARSLTRDDAMAEDLLHDALVRAYERPDARRNARNLRTWLFSVIHNLFIDDWRRKEAGERRDQAYSLFLPDTVVEDIATNLRLKQILDLFMALPIEQRAALHLVTLEEMSYQEAADALNIPIGTLMSRLSRARATIRELEDGEALSDRRRTPLRVVGGKLDN